jgi:hypothetical protein
MALPPSTWPAIAVVIVAFLAMQIVGTRIFMRRKPGFRGAVVGTFKAAALGFLAGAFVIVAYVSIGNLVLFLFHRNSN